MEAGRPERARSAAPDSMQAYKYRGYMRFGVLGSVVAFGSEYRGNLVLDSRPDGVIYLFGLPYALMRRS